MKNVTVGECKTGKKKKTKFKSVGGECKSGKTKNKVQKRWRRMQVWKKKNTKVKSLGKCYRWNLKKSGDGKDIIKKD